MLGDILREERERQNLSIKDIERETSIRTLYISSIETGQYDAVPGEVYLKGFIRTYATFLGLDGAAILKLYYEEKKVDQQEELSELSAGAAETAFDERADRKSVRELREEKKQESGGMIKLVAGVFACMCIGGAVYFFWGDSAAEVKETKAAVTEPVKKAEPVAQPKAKPAEPVINTVEVKATFNGTCWMQVEADGKVLFEGIPNKGESLQWKADKELLITAGNAGAVELVSNGKSLGKLGNDGEVVTKKFTKEGGALPKQ